MAWCYRDWRYKEEEKPKSLSPDACMKKLEAKLTSLRKWTDYVVTLNNVIKAMQEGGCKASLISNGSGREMLDTTLVNLLYKAIKEEAAKAQAELNKIMKSVGDV